MAAWFIRHVVQVALRVRVLQVDRRVDDAVIDAEDRRDRLDGSGRTQEVPDHRLCARDGDLLRTIAHDPLDRRGFGFIVELGRGPVGVDVVDLLGTDVGILERFCHGAGGTIPILFRHHDVKGVVGHGEPDDLAIDLRRAALGVLERLEHQHAGPFTGDEPVALRVERPTGLGRIL